MKNYSFFGESSGRRCGYNKKEVQAIKNKYKKEGVYMLPVRKTAENKMPAKEGKKQTNDSFSTIGFAIACLDYDSQNWLIELSKNMPDAPILMDEAIAIQLSRVAKGYQAEQDQGRLLDTTEAAIQNYYNMLLAKYNLKGQDINVNVSSGLISSILDEVDEQSRSNEIDIDYDKEQKKQALKEVRAEGIHNILDRIDE